MSHKQNLGNWRARGNPSQIGVRMSAFSILEAWFWVAHVNTRFDYDSIRKQVLANRLRPKFYPRNATSSKELIRMDLGGAQ